MLFELPTKITTTSRAGFEPTRGNPIGFQVQRLNHSAIVTPIVAMLPGCAQRSSSEGTG